MRNGHTIYYGTTGLILLKFLSLRSTCTIIPDRKPCAALEPTSETTVQISITKDSSLEFMSLEAIASSIPANKSKTPSIPTGNWSKIFPKEVPNTKPNINLAVPRSTTHPPLLPPKLYCPANPPSPWQLGIAPNQHPITFINPTVTESDVADKSFPGKRSVDNLHTPITELFGKLFLLTSLPEANQSVIIPGHLITSSYS